MKKGTGMRCPVSLYMGTTGGNRYSLTVREYGEDGEMLENKASVEADFSNRFETKNRIKRMLYGLLSEKTKKELPWGTLTGIRPTKIAMTKLLEGKKEDEIRTYMKETYLASDAKIDLSIEIAERERELLSRSIMKTATACMWESRSARRRAFTVPLPHSLLKLGKADGRIFNSAF